MGDILQPPGHLIAYFPAVAKIVGSIKAAILVQQIGFCTKRGPTNDGWIYKDYDDWMLETGLSPKELRSSINTLESQEFIEKEYDRQHHVLRIRLNIEHYNKAIQDISEETPPTKHVPKRHMPKEHVPKRNMQNDLPEKSINYENSEHAPKEHMPKGHMPKGEVASAKREDGIFQKGICAYKNARGESLEKETKEKETPPAPSTANAAEVISNESPAAKFVNWWNERIVPLGGRPFSLEDADDKFIAKANKALKAKGTKGFWDRVEHGFQASGFLRGKVKPPPGKRQFKATLPWLLSKHHTKDMANYALVAENEWADEPEPEYKPKFVE
jgi:hypothetical protein